MEHRYYPRERVQLYADIIGNDGKRYPVWVQDMSAIGMRVTTSEQLPESIKSVYVQLHIPDTGDDSNTPLRMFVTHKNGRELGLCLTNETNRLSLEKILANSYSYALIRKYASN